MPAQKPKWRIYVFKWCNSGQVVAGINATSLWQAVCKLGRRKGREWVADALDRGLIHVDRATNASAPIQKRVRQRLDDERFQRLKEAGRIWWWED